MNSSHLYTIVSVSDLGSSPSSTPHHSPPLVQSHSHTTTAASVELAQHSLDSPCTPPAVPDLSHSPPSRPCSLPPVPGITRKPPPCTTEKELEAHALYCHQAPATPAAAAVAAGRGIKRARVFDFGCLSRRKERPIERGEIVFKAGIVCFTALAVVVLSIIVSTKSTSLPPFLKSSFTTFVCIEALCLVASTLSIPVLLKRIRHYTKYFNTIEYLKGLENGEDLRCPHEWQLHFITAVLVVTSYIAQANVWAMAWLAIGKAPYDVVLIPTLAQGTNTFIICAVIELHCLSIQILRHLIASQIASSPRRTC